MTWSHLKRIKVHSSKGGSTWHSFLLVETIQSTQTQRPSPHLIYVQVTGDALPPGWNRDYMTTSKPQSICWLVHAHCFPVVDNQIRLFVFSGVFFWTTSLIYYTKA